MVLSEPLEYDATRHFGQSRRASARDQLVSEADSCAADTWQSPVARIASHDADTRTNKSWPGG